MDLGSFLILTAFMLLLDVIGLYAKKGVFFLFSAVAMLGVLASAIQDNASSGGQGFVVGQALSSGGNYVLRYQPLVPLVYLGIFTLLVSGILLVTNRKHFV